MLTFGDPLDEPAVYAAEYFVRSIVGKFSELELLNWGAPRQSLMF